MPMLKTIAGHTSARGIRRYLEVLEPEEGESR